MHGHGHGLGSGADDERENNQEHQQSAHHDGDSPQVSRHVPVVHLVDLGASAPGRASGGQWLGPGEWLTRWP